MSHRKICAVFFLHQNLLITIPLICIFRMYSIFRLFTETIRRPFVFLFFSCFVYE